MSTQTPLRTAVDGNRGDLLTFWRSIRKEIGARSHLIRYVALAVVTIAINIAAQTVVLLVPNKLWLGIYAAIAVGNGAGLVFKYFADKYWVFTGAAGVRAHSESCCRPASHAAGSTCDWACR